MANMLRKQRGNTFGCCSHCSRNKKPHNKPGRRERHMARAMEKRNWKKEAVA